MFKKSTLLAILLHIAIAALLCILIYLYEPEILNAFERKDIDLANLTNSLINIAMILFGISGAWIALVFPRALKSLTKSNVKDIVSNDEVVAFKDISTTAALSLIVLIVLLIISYTYGLSGVFNYKEQAGYYSLYPLSVCYVIQCFCAIWSAKTTIRVFFSYAEKIIHRSANEGLERQEVTKKQDETF